MKKTALLLSLVLLGGCATNVTILKPEAVPVAEIASVTQIATVARAAGNQPDIVALAEQVNQILAIQSNVANLQKALYDERAGGSNYSDAMRGRLEEAIPAYWKLGEEASNLYQIAERSRPELAAEGMALAKSILDVAGVSEESGQLGLGYVFAGLEWNAGYLKADREAYFNNLEKRRSDALGSASASMKQFIAHLASVQAGGGSASFIMLKEGTSVSNPVGVLFEGNGPSDAKKEALVNAVQKMAAKTSLAARHGKVSIILNVSDMDNNGGVRGVGNVVSFLLIGYTVGGKATFSASVQEAGNSSIPLKVDTFEIDAKHEDTLLLLMTYRIVGAADLALLRKDMK